MSPIPDKTHPHSPLAHLRQVAYRTSMTIATAREKNLKDDTDTTEPTEET